MSSRERAFISLESQAVSARATKHSFYYLSKACYKFTYRY